MKVLVTGGAGFIGSHLVRQLQAENAEIVVLDDLSTGLKEHLPAGIPLVEMDVRDKAVMDIFAREKFDAVVHLAGQTMVNISIDDPIEDAERNILGTMRLLEGVRKHQVGRIIFASTAAAYGDVKTSHLPIAETEGLHPLSFYGLSKVTAERYMKRYHDIFGLDYVALRFSNVYGERQGDGGEGGVISIFTKRIAQGKDITIFGDGEQTRDFIYAGDIAGGICAALKTENRNTTYNLSTQEETSLKELVELLSEIAGRKIIPAYAEARKGDIVFSSLSNGRAMRALSWKPTMELKEGLRRTYEYFRGI